MKLQSLVGVVACALGITASAQAQITSDSPHALGGGREYILEGNPGRFRPAFFDVFVDDWYFQMTGPAHPSPAPGTGSSFGQSPLNSTMVTRFGASQPAPSPGPGFSSFFDVFTEISLDGSYIYDTEMLQLDLQGSHPNGGPFMIRESPTLASTGRYSVQPLPGGVYRIDSFFDIFTEISLDGGQTWTPSDESTRVRIMPTPGAAALLCIGGAVLTGRRRR